MLNRYIVIMAGGRGERFWPQSRLHTPKHLLPIVGDKPMLRQTVERAMKLVPKDNIYIITNNHQVAGVKAVCPDLVQDQIIGEPVGRDTAAVVGLAMVLIKNKDPKAVFSMLPADHVVNDDAGFKTVMDAAFEAAEARDVLVTVGIKPTFPATGYGYIHRGQVMATYNDQAVYQVQRFVEKPPLDKAKEYLASGEYEWNAGIFVWSVPTIEHAFEQLCPELKSSLDSFSEALKCHHDFDTLLAAEYPKFKKISIDYAIMEKSQNVVTLESRFDWDDVGSWLAIARHEMADAAGNVSRGSVALKDCKNTIAVGGKDHVIALMGLEDVIVVQTPDATLVCSKDKAESLKELLKDLESNPGYGGVL